MKIAKIVFKVCKRMFNDLYINKLNLNKSSMKPQSYQKSRKNRRIRTQDAMSQPCRWYAMSQP